MSVFSDAELAYLTNGKLGRLAIDAAGIPQSFPQLALQPPGWTRSTLAAGTSPRPGSFTTHSRNRMQPRDTWSLVSRRAPRPAIWRGKHSLAACAVHTPV